MKKAIRKNQYDLRCNGKEYIALKTALNEMVSIYTPADKRGWENYLIFNPSPVTISLQESSDNVNSSNQNIEKKVLMNVTRTTFFKPAFVKQIVKRLNGKTSGESVHTNSSTIDLFLGCDYKEFQNRHRY